MLACFNPLWPKLNLGVACFDLPELHSRSSPAVESFHSADLFTSEPTPARLHIRIGSAEPCG